MKIFLSILLLLIPSLSLAQNIEGMSEEEMQRMMQQVQQAAMCMQNIDHSKLKGLEERSNKMQNEVKALCEGGKRDEAQKRAIAFGRKMAGDPVIAEIKKCGDVMKGAVSRLAFMDEEKDLSNHHVCDSYKEAGQ